MHHVLNQYEAACYGLRLCVGTAGYPGLRVYAELRPQPYERTITPDCPPFVVSPKLQNATLSGLNWLSLLGRPCFTHFGMP